MLPNRYPAPIAEEQFAEETKILSWTILTRLFMREAMQDDGVQGADLYRQVDLIQPPDPMDVQTREASTGHDVVAFLSIIEDALPSDLAPYLHYGLTSSDLVENANQMALRGHAQALNRRITSLTQALSRFGFYRTTRAGRTHGQLADLTSWNHQIGVQIMALNSIQRDLQVFHERRILKSPGPVGMCHVEPMRGDWVSAQMGAQIVSSTQIIPRDHQMQWACLYLRLCGVYENLALLVRLGSRSEVAEVQEGYIREGSSAMPAKKNPIDSEKVCGLARVARGYFTTLAEGVALWEDRDLSNSSMERVALPGLAATIEHMTDTLIKVFDNLILNQPQMRFNATRWATMAHIMQAHAQKKFKIGPRRASHLIAKRKPGENPLAVPQLAEDLGVDREEVRAWFREVNEIWETCW